MGALGDITYTAVANGSGTAVITIPQRAVIWVVSQVSIEMDTNAAASCALRKNGYLVSPLVPQADSAAGDPPIRLLPGDVMTITWTGCNPGDIAKAYVIYTKESFA